MSPQGGHSEMPPRQQMAPDHPLVDGIPTAQREPDLLDRFGVEVSQSGTISIPAELQSKVQIKTNGSNGNG